MSNSFQFKQFSLQQKNTAMKVGTDGVLLGAWCNSNGNNILDIGTGTGLIALMLAQRNNDAKIDAIEIDKEAFNEAKLNFSNSPWEERLTIIHSSIQHFSNDNSYDLIVCNPPFFINSTKAPEGGRNIARHTVQLPFKDLVTAICSLLNTNGTFALILPVKESQLFIELAQKDNLFLNRKCEVKPNLTNPVKRILMEFSYNNSDLIQEEITIETENRHQYTKEYISLTKDFYLNF